MDLGLKGKKVAVTGGSKGIGRAIAQGFAAEGAGVSICARNAAEVDATVAALKAKGVSALAVGDSAESWQKSFSVDMMHTVNAVQAAVPFLEKSSSGSIVLISSVS